MLLAGVLSLLVPHALGQARSDGPATAPADAPIPLPLPGAPGDGMIVERNVMVAMRDGVRLATDVYRPAAAGRHPVVLVRTPYGSETQEWRFKAQFYVRHGYAYAVQDVRGKYDSEGDWHGRRNEAHDGSDTITWLGTRPWSSGRVGMTGVSYMGLVQYWVADQENPYLKALVPIAAPATLGRELAEYDHIAHYGGRESYSELDWLLMTDGRVNQDDGAVLRRYGEQNIGAYVTAKGPVALAAAPGGLSDLVGGSRYVRRADYPRLLGRPMPWLPFLVNQRYGYWEEYFLRAAAGEWSEPIAQEPWWAAYKARYRRVQVPMLHISGWFDCCSEQQMKMFRMIREHARDPLARGNQQLMLGPWTHGIGGSKTGQLDFGPEAALDPDEASVRWFDRWLKGEDNGVDRQPPVRAFVMGENRWREAQDWPIPGTRFTRFYLRSQGEARLSRGGGGLSTEGPGDEPPDRYTYDPGNPTPVMPMAVMGTTQGGPVDMREVQSRDDVLVYSSEVLKEPVEVTGPLSAVLYVSTTAPSTDFIVRLVDVHPDGAAYNMHLSYANPYRTHWAKEVRTAPDGTRIVKAEIELPATSTLFQAGHRIRIEISSAAAPRIRGLNVEPGTEAHATQWNVARQTLYHDRERPSYVVLPVVPRAPEPRRAGR